MALTDVFVRQTKWSGAEAGDKHSDGKGLYLLVKPGGKYWRLNYRFLGKQKTLAIGVYPAVSLAGARAARDRARELLAAGRDPSGEKQSAVRQAKQAAAAQFESIALEWMAVTAGERGAKTNSRIRGWFERELFPHIGRRPIADIRPSELLDVFKHMEARGILDSMRRVLGYTSKVFRYAMIKELADRDPTIGLADALERPSEGHYAAITDPAELGALLRAIDGYNGQPACRAALKLAPLLFQRPGELRRMEWAELDLDAGEWRIAGTKMKMNNDHIVPLPRQAIETLKWLYQITGNWKWVFPSTRGSDRPMSDNTVNAALRTLGYGSDVMVGHGFRATARTILDEVLGERVDFIEHQLAHAVKDPNGRAYNRTAHLPARREMMQRWADYLDTLRAGAKATGTREA